MKNGTAEAADGRRDGREKEIQREKEMEKSLKRQAAWTSRKKISYPEDFFEAGMKNGMANEVDISTTIWSTLTGILILWEVN